MSQLIQDLRYAARALRRAPMYTAVIALTLALGIGATTALFSALEALLLRPLPYPHVERLALVGNTSREPGAATVDTMPAWSYPKLQTLRTAAGESFDGFAAFSALSANLTDRGAAERLEGEIVSPEYFQLLGVEAVRGRVFASEEGAVPGAAAVALIGEGLWQRRFGGDAGAVGSTIRLDGQPFTVVGILPAGFDGLTGAAEVWVPITMATALLWPQALEEPWSHWFRVLARRSAGVGEPAASAAIASAGRRVAETHPPPFGEAVRSAALLPLDAARLDPRMRTAVLVLLGAVTLLLLIGCVNIANLLLSRSAARRREIAVRLALGASRRRLIGQLLTESLLMAAAGGALGLVVAAWGIELLARLAPGVGALGAGGMEGLYGLDRMGLNGPVTAFAAGLVLLTTLLFGLAPALSATRPELVGFLRGPGATGPGSVSRRGRGRSALIPVEVALSAVLLIGAGLLLRTVRELRAIEIGARTEQVLTFRVDAGSAYERPERASFLQRMTRELAGLPGVESVGLNNCAPVSDACNSTVVMAIEGEPPIPEGEGPVIGFHYASPAYFEALDIPLVAGRVFDARNVGDAPKAVVLSETAGRELFPGGLAIGRRVWLGTGYFGGEMAEVIGVVGDVRYGPPEMPARAEAYIPAFQFPSSTTTVFVRTASDPYMLAGPARRVVGALNAEVPIFDITTMRERTEEVFARSRFLSLLLGVFAGLALLLAAIGLYGVLAFAVVSRTREIGVRMAVGARVRDVLRLVIVDGLALAGIGLVAGLATAFGLARFLESLLYGVEPADPTTFVVVAVTLVATSLLASWLPARRAAEVDPMRALRAE